MTAWPAPDGRPSTVLTDDGVALSLRTYGDDTATGTVLLLHGYELDQTLWARQVAALRAARPDLRVVSYDHRGHGQSGRTEPAGATLAQLGRDLRTVLDSLPDGPVTLVGHSMGGMTIMAFVEQFPEAVGGRVVAVGLLGTSSAGMADVDFGVSPRFARAAAVVVPAFNAYARARELRGQRKPWQPGMRWLLFGAQPHRADVHRTLAALAGCPAVTCETFYWTFHDHDRTAALKHLAQVPVLVACGDRDRLTPLAHSRTIAAELPQAEFVVYPGCGHMLMLERADDVSRRLLDLVTSPLPRVALPAG